MNRKIFSKDEPVIRQAEWPADEIAAEELLRGYIAFLSIRLTDAPAAHTAELEAELGSLRQTWVLPNGVLLLAFLGSRPAGCVAIKLRHDRTGTCEMKRLWVADHARGQRVGRGLVESGIVWAQQHGTHTLLLDTVPEAMPEAVALYQSLGFKETDRHNSNPVPGLKFFHLELG